MKCGAQLTRLSAPARGSEKAATLPGRVNPGIGSTSPHPHGCPAHQALEHRLKFRLNRAIDRLPLPPCKPAPIVLNHREKGAAGHARKDATRCHYLTRVIALIPHGCLAAARCTDRTRQPPITI